MAMIDRRWVRMMARYNAWQNNNLYDAADTLSDSERRVDKGAFFGSVHGTLCHVLWADKVWMARLEGENLRLGSIAESPNLIGGWGELKCERSRMDEKMSLWAYALDESDLAKEVEWYSLAQNSWQKTPRDVCVIHLFNHQTHHRGQVHAMLTSLGAKPGDTDLAIMPRDVDIS